MSPHKAKFSIGNYLQYHYFEVQLLCHFISYMAGGLAIKHVGLTLYSITGLKVRLRCSEHVIQ